MEDFLLRTEDIKSECLFDLYVETDQDRSMVEALMTSTPLVMEGSRGTGKTFLMRVAEARMLDPNSGLKKLPVYISFISSSLVQSGNPNQFIHWMMSKICACVLRTLYSQGKLIKFSPALSLLAAEPVRPGIDMWKIETVTKSFEDSYRAPGSLVDDSRVPTVDDFKDAIEEICRDLKIDRIFLLFDEAAHIFRPEQQRQFFTLFRDLRSPYICCKAAVYPGVTFYGQTFQLTHDATMRSLVRNPLDPDYLGNMRKIVSKQASAQIQKRMEERAENFNALAYAVSGNPRLLLKTLSLSSELKANDVKKILKDFYRGEMWSEHSGLSARFRGHSNLIDWGRHFIERQVIPDAIKKNEDRSSDGKAESTCFFWVHRDAPAVVYEALRILSYTGIVTQLDTGVVATRGETGARYSVNLGCLASPAAEPVSALTHLGRSLSLKRFTEYGANHPSFLELTKQVTGLPETDTSQYLKDELAKPISSLPLTEFQMNSLSALGISTIGEALHANEETFQNAYYVGSKRSRKIMNIVTSAVLEYLSG